MNPSHLLLVPLAIAGLFITGCDGSRSDYPDRSPETARRVDDVKRNARDQKDAIDREYDERITKLDFDERQVREKFKADREAFFIESDRETAARKSKRREIELQAKHDRDQIDTETKAKLRTSPADQAAQIEADAAARKSEIDNRVTKDLAPLVSDTDKNDTRVAQRRLEIDLEESKRISAIERERSAAREKLRTRRLEVDRWTTDELSKVEKDRPQDAPRR